VGIADDEPLREGSAGLEPGDALLVFSDGLVEDEGRTADLAERAPARAGGAGAARMVGRLLERTPTRPADDVTVVVLLRRHDGRPGRE
jgi:serine phosphatase RsbU (regulator of sigma subunit)